MIDRILGWMARPKTRRALMTLRILRWVAIIVGVALILAGARVGIRP